MQLLVMLLAFLLVAGLGGVLTAGLVMPAVGAAGAVSQSTTELFDDLPSELAIPEPSQSSQILAADGSVMASIYADNRIVVPLEAISPNVRDAVVAIEDRRFYDHRGVDPEGMLRALVNNLAGGPLEGASTLTQQYVKNVLIEAGRISGDEAAIDAATETTLGRKLEEARLAIGLEQKVSKEDILEGYLNIAQFGPSQYGVETASKYYFSKSAKDLTVAESAMLAGITQSPARHDPVRNPEGAKVRRDQVLKRMLEQKYISQAEYDEAVAIPIEEMLNVSRTPNGCAAAGISAYFCEYVVDELLQSEEWGKDLADRQQALYRGGLVIHTTIDPAKQQAAYDSVTASVPVNDPSTIKMALSSVEPGTGKIQAMVQNTNWGNPTAEDPGATKVNLNAGLSHGGGRGFQSGSSFKVFTLVEWLETGHTLNDQVVANRRSYPRESWNISCGKYEDNYEPKNLESSNVGGRISVLEATRQSVNLPFVEMANQMDMCNVVDTAAAMGIRTGSGDPLTPNPAAVLGSNTVTPLSQAVAFATLAARGKMCEPLAITKITDREGTEIAAPQPTCTQAIEQNVADGATGALQTVVTPQRGSTGINAVLPDGRPAAGKTGTANDDSAAWFVGYTPQLAAAVWMGYQEGTKSMFDSTINGQFYDLVYGGRIPAPTWRNYVTAALNGVPHQPFPPVPPTALYGNRVPVPDVAGRSAAEAQTMLTQAGFQVQMGSPVSSGWQAGAAVATNPGAGTRAAPGTMITIIPSAGPAPEPAPAPAPAPPEPAEPPSDNPGNNGNGNGKPNDEDDD